MDSQLRRKLLLGRNAGIVWRHDINVVVSCEVAAKAIDKAGFRVVGVSRKGGRNDQYFHEAGFSSIQIIGVAHLA